MIFSDSGSCDNSKQNALGLGLQVIVWRLFFFLMLCVVMILALLPTSGTLEFPVQDKLLHLMAFSSLFFMGAKAYPRKAYTSQASLRQALWKWSYLYLGLFFYGVLMEFLQGQISYRSMEALDLLADSLGLVVGHCSLVLSSKVRASFENKSI